MATNVSGLPALVIGRVEHIGKTYWHRVGHIPHKSIGGNPQSELQNPQEGFAINLQLWDSRNFKSSPSNLFCFLLLPLRSPAFFSCLAELPWLPLNRTMRRLECVWRSRRSSRQMKAQGAIPGFCKSAPSFLLRIHMIPLSTTLRLSIKRLDSKRFV